MGIKFSTKIKTLFAIISCSCIMASCSAYAGQEVTELSWAIAPTMEGALSFSNHAGLIWDKSSTAGFIDSKGNDLFQNLNLDSRYYLENWNTSHFSGGVVKKPLYALSRCGTLEQIADSNYEIQGTPVKVGQVYVVAVKSNVSTQDAYYGIMNEQQSWIEEPIFYKFEMLPLGCCLLYYGGQSPYTIIINADGHISKISQFLESTSQKAISDADTVDPWFAMKNAWGENCYIDKNGKIMLGCPYAYCENFSEGLAVIQTGGKYGYMDREGKIVVEPQFEYAQPFSDGVATVNKTTDGGCELIDPQGKVVLKTNYDSIGMFENDIAIFTQNGKWGIIDKTGTEIIKNKYQFIKKLNNCYLLGRGDQYGLYLPACDRIIEPKYSEISYSGGNCVIVQKHGKYGILSIETGEILIKPQYTEIGHFGEGTMYIRSRANYGIVANNGDMILPVDGTYFLNPGEGFGDAIAPVRVDDKWGYIANPQIYPKWEPDVLSRASSLGLYINTQDCTSESFLRLLFDMIWIQKDLMGDRMQLADTDMPKTYADLQQLLNISDIESASPITRQQAAFILTQLSKKYGNATDFFINYCADVEEVEETYASAVAYVSSLGIFDIQANCFRPTQTLNRSETLSIITLFFEEMLDSPTLFEWSVNEQIITINGLSILTIGLQSPSTLSQNWW